MATATTDRIDGRTERSKATRAALRDAAISCLVDFGYAGTTTAEISDRAGVSPGLFTRYWPSKLSLIADAAAHAQRQGFRRLAARFEATSSDEGDPRLVTLTLLFDMFAEPEMLCLAELEIASRTDVDLAEALNEVLIDVESFIVSGSRNLAPATEITPDFDARLRVVLDIARGLALRTSRMKPKEAQLARAESMAVLADLLGLPA